MPSIALEIGETIDLRSVQTVSAGGVEVRMSSAAHRRLRETREQLEAAIARGQRMYGVNTGFGALSETAIDPKSLGDLQRNLLRSHAVGVGAPFDAGVVRALLFLRAHTLALGASGASSGLASALLELLAEDVLPVVPSQGSVGASGDLAPLAHLALPLIGEGEVEYRGRRMSAAQALGIANIEPFSLGPKEGLSLINGTQVTSAVSALALGRGLELLTAADILGSASLDALMGTVAICDPRIHAGKPHPGQGRSAQLIAELVRGSSLNASHADCGRVQDAYCLRCMPQVHGAVRRALLYVAEAVTVEINSFTDNPLILHDGDGGFDILSGGNFHAATVALPADHATAALTSLATISERRLDRFLNPDSSRGLPAFLADNPGLESGFMMAQVTASALASECKAMSFPAAVDTIPTSAGKEDHVSMGPIAARKLAAVVDNLSRVLAVEASIACRALDLRDTSTSPRLQAVHAKVREYVAPFTGDRSMGDEFESLAAAICRGELRVAADVEHELDVSPVVC